MVRVVNGRNDRRQTQPQDQPGGLNDRAGEVVSCFIGVVPKRIHIPVGHPWSEERKQQPTGKARARTETEEAATAAADRSDHAHRADDVHRTGNADSHGCEWNEIAHPRARRRTRGNNERRHGERWRRTRRTLHRRGLRKCKRGHSEATKRRPELEGRPHSVFYHFPCVLPDERGPQSHPGPASRALRRRYTRAHEGRAAPRSSLPVARPDRRGSLADQRGVRRRCPAGAADDPAHRGAIAPRVDRAHEVPSERQPRARGPAEDQRVRLEPEGPRGDAERQLRPSSAREDELPRRHALDTCSPGSSIAMGSSTTTRCPTTRATSSRGAGDFTTSTTCSRGTGPTSRRGAADLFSERVQQPEVLRRDGDAAPGPRAAAVSAPARLFQRPRRGGGMDRRPPR